ncbi:MAG: kinase/pyrophosphorylase [Rhizobiales bacterium]|nr:kinase/pyrophosphorylase [Hyphomicrobiales bacterium]
MRLHMHLVSDSTGDTVTTVARAGISQFDGVVPVEHVWSFVRSRAQVEQVLSMVKALPGVVIYTMVSPDLRKALEEGCRELKTPAVPILDGVFKALSGLLGAETRQAIGRQHAMDDGYFSRIEAMDFMLQHDDGQSPWDLDNADIVLVGVSRASKTPTCIYLANRGLKTANVPVVMDCPLPKELATLTKPLVVGLTINPEPLVQIRSNRLRQMERGGAPLRLSDDYTEIERVRAELVYARRLFARYDWPVIDVTRRSVEETAAAVFQLFQGRVGRLAARAAGGPPPA